MTLPVRPLSLPDRTSTVSPFLMRSLAISEHLRCERDDPHEALVAQLTTDGAEDARAARLTVGAEDHRSVLVELDVRAVGTSALLDGAHDDRLDDLALFDVATGDGVLDGRHDDVTDARVAAPRPAENADAQELLGTRVVGDSKSRLLLDHVCLLECLLVLVARRASDVSMPEWVEPGGTDGLLNYWTAGLLDYFA